MQGRQFGLSGITVFDSIKNDYDSFFSEIAKNIYTPLTRNCS